MNIVERFLQYTTINTTTDVVNSQKGILPSSAGQLQLAQLIEQELIALGLQEIVLNEQGILTATLPSNVNDTLPTVAFFAHLDTSSELSTDTVAQIKTYDGSPVVLNESLGIELSAEMFPELENYRGQQIITTDGTSLLGADDKAAIAAIMNALQVLQNDSSIPHGTIKVAFLPDEEQGMLGAKVFNTSVFGADFGYTLDCCGIGDFVCENWNAGHGTVVFHGQSAHPMSAKGKLKNSLLMAHKFIAMLPSGEAPEHTEHREGYYWVKQLQGNSVKTTLAIDIRDFSDEGYLHRKQFLQSLVDGCNALWGTDTVELTLSDSYENVANHLKDNNYYPIDIAFAAYRKNGIEPKVIPMRGGYDGSILSQRGIPCPNIFTGAHNFHSIYEYLPVDSLKAASQVVVDIIAGTKQHFCR